MIAALHMWIPGQRVPLDPVRARLHRCPVEEENRVLPRADRGQQVFLWIEIHLPGLHHISSVGHGNVVGVTRQN